MDAIGRTWPDQLPDNLPYVLPRWDDGDAWRLRGETGALINHRPRAPINSPPLVHGQADGPRLS